jgi:hypothetical protein
MRRATLPSTRSHPSLWAAFPALESKCGKSTMAWGPFVPVTSRGRLALKTVQRER